MNFATIGLDGLLGIILGALGGIVGTLFAVRGLREKRGRGELSEENYRKSINTIRRFTVALVILVAAFIASPSFASYKYRPWIIVVYLLLLFGLIIRTRWRLSRSS